MISKESLGFKSMLDPYKKTAKGKQQLYYYIFTAIRLTDGLFAAKMPQNGLTDFGLQVFHTFFTSSDIRDVL
jgi:hypothetical protein